MVKTPIFVGRARQQKIAFDFCTAFQSEIKDPEFDICFWLHETQEPGNGSAFFDDDVLSHALNKIDTSIDFLGHTLGQTKEKTVNISVSDQCIRNQQCINVETRRVDALKSLRRDIHKPQCRVSTPNEAYAISIRSLIKCEGHSVTNLEAVDHRITISDFCGGQIKVLSKNNADRASYIEIIEIEILTACTHIGLGRVSDNNITVTSNCSSTIQLLELGHCQEQCRACWHNQARDTRQIGERVQRDDGIVNQCDRDGEFFGVVRQSKNLIGEIYQHQTRTVTLLNEEVGGADSIRLIHRQRQRCAIVQRNRCHVGQCRVGQIVCAPVDNQVNTTNAAINGVCI